MRVGTGNVFGVAGAGTRRVTDIRGSFSAITTICAGLTFPLLLFAACLALRRIATLSRICFASKIGIQTHLEWGSLFSLRHRKNTQANKAEGDDKNLAHFNLLMFCSLGFAGSRARYLFL
jgi:hypothetical protein